MTGKRLYVGIAVMGAAVPIVLFMLLQLTELVDLLAISVTCMLGWAVAHLAGDILARRRLDGRNNPVNALRQWEQRDDDQLL